MEPSNYKILIIDDDPIARSLLRQSLQKEDAGGGFVVVEVSTFEKADIADVLAKEKPDAIILDIMDDRMRKAVGDERVGFIRGDCGVTETPIIMMTSPDKRPFKAAVEAIRNGAQDILFKEDVAQKINDRVRKCIQAIEDERDAEEARKRREKRQFNKGAAVSAAVLALIDAFLNFVASQIPWFTSVVYALALICVVAGIAVFAGMRRDGD